jgi:hypothetical protein
VPPYRGKRWYIAGAADNFFYSLGL